MDHRQQQQQQQQQQPQQQQRQPQQQQQQWRQSGATSHTYRLGLNVGMELLFLPNQAPSFDFGEQGLLESVTFSNFSGRIIIHRQPDFNESSEIFSITSDSSAAPMSAATMAAGAAAAATTAATHQTSPAAATAVPEAPVAIEEKKEANDRLHGGADAAFGGNALELPTTSEISADEDGFADEPFVSKPAAGAPLQLSNSADSGDTDKTEESVLKAAAKFKAGLSSSHDEEEGNSTLLVTHSGEDRHQLLQKQLGGVIQSVLRINKAKRSIPEPLRLERRQRLNYAHSMNERTLHRELSLRDLVLPPTPLHELCNLESVSLEELLECMHHHPAAVRTKDHLGRYPLHLLGDNETLLQTQSGKHAATAFGNHLIDAYPEAIITPDNEGFCPFFAILSDWIVWANDQEKLKQNAPNKKAEDYSARSDLDEAKSLCYPGTSLTRLVFPRVEIWDEVEWCLNMLSSALDTLGRNLALPTFQQTRRSVLKTIGRKDERTILVEQLATQLPSLFPTILLVDEDGMDSRVRALELPVFRHLLMCPDVVDLWLVNMLNHGGVPSQRAVDYLDMVSTTSVDDWTGGFGSALPTDWRNFRANRKKVYRAVSGLKGVMASLVTLSERDMERASSTAVVWYVMSLKLGRPFVLGLVLIDLVLHLSMMVAFRTLAGVKPNLPDTYDTALVASNIIYIIGAHYLVRTCSEACAMYSLSSGALKGYLLDLWNIFGIAAIIMTISATAVVRNKGDKPWNGLNSFVIGLLWIKVLAFLKVVNKDLSTFILSLTQILYDIRLFMLVLAVCVFMFGDMWHIAVSEQSNGEYCLNEGLQEGGAIGDFCSSTWESYLRVYSILLGDFELDDISSTTGSTILFIIFTIFGVIILLNVLIAIISDSYEKATLSSHALFGRARVMFVAQNEALEHFLKPRKRKTKRFALLKTIGRWFMLIAILSSALYTEVWLVGAAVKLSGSSNGQETAYFAVAVVLSSLLAAALWVVATFLLDDVLRWLLPDRAEHLYDAFGKFNNALVRKISGFLFGFHKEKFGVVSQVNNEMSANREEEWGGRMNYLERAVAELVADAKRDLKSEILEVKAEIQNLDRNKL